MKNLIVILLSGGLLTASCVRALSLDESRLLPHPLPQERTPAPTGAGPTATGFLFTEYDRCRETVSVSR